MRKLICLLTVLLLAAAPVGCTGVAVVQPDEECVSFTDALERRVTVPKSVRRVAALIGSFADVWMLAGGTVCAAAEDAWEDFGLELGDAVNLGGAHSPSLEALFSARPELVLASASTASNVRMKESLESAGITVAYFDVDNFEDYLQMLAICTDITGRKDLYAQNGLQVAEQIEAIREEFARAALSAERRTVLVLRVSSGSIKAKGSSGTILGEMLNDLGCINIADSDESLLENLSVESVIRCQPYRIFAVTMGDEARAAENLNRMLAQSPVWSSLDAVKNGRLHLMQRELFNLKPNADWARSYEKLREIFLGEK